LKENQDPHEFNRHWQEHLKGTYVCEKANCSKVFNAFSHARVTECVKVHLESHKCDKERMIGITKMDKEFKCNETWYHRVSNEFKQCGYQFQLKRDFQRHQRRHNLDFKCDFVDQHGNECNFEINAFEHECPGKFFFIFLLNFQISKNIYINLLIYYFLAKDLLHHQLTSHDVQDANCPQCKSWFRDEVYGSIKFTADEQIELHKKYGCYDWKVPVNYIWFQVSDDQVKQLDLPNRSQIVYSGQSGHSIFRPLDQLIFLHDNHLMPADQQVKKVERLYQETFGHGKGIYLTFLAKDKVTSVEDQAEKRALAKASEFVSKYLLK